MGFIDHKGKTHGLYTGTQGKVVVHVSLPGILDAFFLQHHQGFVQCIQGVDRRGMVIGALGIGAPVAHHQVGIEEPALHLGMATRDHFYGALTEAYR